MRKPGVDSLFSIAIAGLAFTLVACSSGGSDSAHPMCVTGAVIECPCLGGSMGIQRCGADGTYGECTCPSPDAFVDAVSDDGDGAFDASDGTADGPIADGDGSLNGPIDDADGTSDGPLDFGDGSPCSGYACKPVDCGTGTPTSISGTAFAPNGTLPLYNAIVYVPTTDPTPFTKGVACDRCGAVPSGAPLVTTLSDATGHFELKNVPVGKDIPLVLQVGKWRRKVSIPEVKACVDNPVTDKNLTRLPKKQTEGDMPMIAVTTGGCDQVACMLPKLGIDPSEFGVAGSSKAVHFYSAGGAGGPPGMTDAKPFWSNLTELSKYDISIFSCECYEAPTTKDSTSFKAVTDYLAAGGRIFTSDFQYTWYKFSPDSALSSIGIIPGGAPAGGVPVKIDVSFPKGKALASWLTVVDSVSDPKFDYVFDNISSLDAAKARTWGSSGPFSGSSPVHPRMFTLNAPVGSPASAQCGRAVHLDAHAYNTDRVDASYPAGCSSPSTSGEHVFAALFFDLASCIQPDADTPAPPPVK